MTKKNEKLLIEVSTFIVLGLGFYIYLKTNSIFYAGFVTISSVLIFILMMLVIGLNKRNKLKKSGIEDIDKMKGLLFEEYLFNLFKSIGYKARITKANHDYGADLIIKKTGKKTVVQAKRYKSNVGIKAVQEVVASVSYYQADNAMVITNSFFTKSATELATKNNVTLIDRDALIKMMMQTESKKTG